MRRTALALLVVGLAAQPAYAIYKCKDDKGVTYYTDKPECGGQGSEITNKGVQKPVDVQQQQSKKPDATPEQRAAAEKAKEQARHDQALLGTYTNADEIDLARDRSLSQAQLTLTSAQTRLQSAQDKLALKKKQADGYTVANKPVPQDLQDEVAFAAKEVQQQNTEIAQQQKEMEQIRTKYDADKKRFIELTKQN